MEEVWETWSPQPIDIHAGSPVRPQATHDRRLFWFKAILLLVTTIALVPILLWQHILGAKFYLGFLVVVHVGGLVIFAKGLKRSHFGTTLRGTMIRVGGIAALVALLYLASKGLGQSLDSTVFWISLLAIWLLHTAGAAILHLMPERRSSSFCPFV